METSTPSKTDIIKPLFLKAGIPLALSVAGFVYARIISRRSIDSLKQTGDVKESSHHHDLDSSSVKDDEQIMTVDSNVSGSEESSDRSLEEDVLALRRRIEELQKKEIEMEMKFLQYHVMKEQEFVLMELKNMLVMEAAHVEFLEREISSIEAEKERFQNIMVEYIRIGEAIESVKLENRVLRRKVKKMMKKRMEQLRIIREKKMKIESTEEEVLNFCKVVEMKDDVIKQLEDDVGKLQAIVDQLQEEKNLLLIKLNSADNSALSSTQIEGGWVTMEDYKQLVNKIEQLRQDRASEIAELTYLRWTTACLKHELTRIHDEHEDEIMINDRKQQMGCELEHQPDGIPEKGASMKVGGRFTRNSQDSTRKRLLDKLRRWVEGSSSNNEHLVKEIKCFGRHSVSEDREEDNHNNGRKSYSSV